MSWSLTRVDEASEPQPDVRQRVRSGSKDDAAAEPREPRPSAAASTLPQTPMRWFAGAMPPPALRAAQQHFFRGACFASPCLHHFTPLAFA